MAKNKLKEQKTRTPVVAVMGHVDHGKTSFLDAIRGSRVAEKEVGGITQNTRAHEVVTSSGFKITFIDTPGHEAFSSMRERGAMVTDFVLLIVAADDGVQPQTKESIEFAQKNNVPIIVAINKIDLEGVKIEKIKKTLASYGVVIEEYGGDNLCFLISAKEKKGLNELLEGIELLSEIHGLKPALVSENLTGKAFVLESSQDKNRGNVALCILKEGHLTDKTYGFTNEQIFKVRAFLNEDQKQIAEVFESCPFWVTGLKKTLKVGEYLYFAETEEKARQFSQNLNIEKKDSSTVQIDPESLFSQLLMKREEAKLGIEQKELNLIVKASTEGTLEAILKKLKEIKTSESKVNILHSKTGEVSEDDIIRAKLAKGIIVTFQLPPSKKIESFAKQEKVLLRNYEVIYEMFDEVAEVLESMGEPIEEEVDIAKAKVKQVFVLSDGSIVAGVEVVSGIFIKGYRVKILDLNGKEIGRGKISSLKVLKNEVKEVKKGSDCGVVIDPKIENIEEGFILVAFKIEKY